MADQHHRDPSRLRPSFGNAGSNHGRSIPGAVATAGEQERLTFVRKVYTHLFVSIAVFAGACWVLLGPLFESFSAPMTQWAMSGGMSWLIFLGLFIGVSHLANKWAMSPTSRKTQYFGLLAYAVANAIVTTPLLMVAQLYGGPDVIPSAAFATLLLFGGLTATVFMTKKDFSFLGGFLGIASMGALALIVISMLFGFQLGNVFSVLMIVLSAGYILFHTSQILAHYHPQQYVAASVALFSSVALLFWYVLQLFMGGSRD